MCMPVSDTAHLVLKWEYGSFKSSLKKIDMDIKFKSAFDAVRFALCYSHQQYGHTLMAKLLPSAPSGKGMGLVGLDGAGQAGQIRRELAELPDLYHAVLVARAALPDMPCDCGRPCCSKHKTNEEWCSAIGRLTEASAAHASGFSHYRVRRTIIEKLFNKKGKNLTEISKRCDAHVNTVINHQAAVRRWIFGNPKTREPGIEDTAWARIEQRLTQLGLLETEETSRARATS